MVRTSKNQARRRRKIRIRKKIHGSADCPRMVVYRSNRHIYAQLVDDVAGRTLFSCSTLSLAASDTPCKCDKQGASLVGRGIAEQARKHNIDRVVFDRNGYLYHGKVKAVADGAREAGLTF